MRALVAFAAALLLGASPAQADSSLQFTKGMSNPNAPIEVSADNFSADRASSTIDYMGNVVVRQGEMRMRANALKVHVASGNKPDKIYAQGHVVVDAPSGSATGDSGVYDVNPRIVTLNGHVVLTKNDNVMRGSLLTVNLISGLATLGGGGSKEGQGRVQGLFNTDSQPTPTPQSPQLPQKP